MCSASTARFCCEAFSIIGQLQNCCGTPFHMGGPFFVLFVVYHHSPGHQESQRGPKRALIQVPIASLVGS